MRGRFRRWRTRCANLAEHDKNNNKQELTFCNVDEKNREHGQNEQASCKTVSAPEETAGQKKTAAPIAVGSGGYLSSDLVNSTRENYPNIRHDAIATAARWLNGHRGELNGKAVIPALKLRFGLRNLEAIEAAKIAHSIAYGGGHV